MDNEIISRFWVKVDKNTADQCWNWKGCITSGGYGGFRFHAKDGEMGAHRASWIINFGDIPDGMWVLHRCDNRKCVNPNHLFLGTHQDNVDDMMTKGRGHWRFLYGEDHPQHGTKHWSNKLSEDDVRNIREMKASGKYTLRGLAKMFHVTHGCINNICQGRKWKWLK
jgi:hypothetical protein